MLKCLQQVNCNYGSTVLSYFFLALEEGGGDKNEDNDFATLLHFEAAIVAK